nr:hypothetical protein Iba_chr14dCG4860 [Ipomoea batatas]
MPSENNCIIEDVDNEVNFLNPYDFNDSDSFDSSDDDDENCVDTYGLESFTFDDNSLLNEHVGELHDMLCNVDDELNVDASLLDLNDIEFDTFHDNCLDDAIYIHDLFGEEKEGTDGDLRDVLLSSEKEEEKESVTIEKENEEENFENEKLAKVPFKHRPSLLIYVETLIRAVFDQGISVNLLYVAPPSEVPVPNHLGVSFIIHSKNWIVPTLEELVIFHFIEDPRCPFFRAKQSEIVGHHAPPRRHTAPLEAAFSTIVGFWSGYPEAMLGSYGDEATSAGISRIPKTSKQSEFDFDAMVIKRLTLT